METNAAGADHPAHTASNTGAFMETAAGAADPSRSILRRLGAAASAVKLGADLLPAGWRLVRRYPVASTLALAGLAVALYLTRPSRTSIRF